MIEAAEWSVLADETLGASGTASVLQPGTSVYLYIDAWGWNTKHWHHCDDLVIKSGVEP